MQHGNNNHFLIFFIAKGSFNNIQRIFSHKKYNKSMLGVLSSLSLLTQRKFRRHSQAPSSSILTTLLWKVKETEGRKNFACGENVVRKSETGRRWKFVMGTSILLREKQCFARGRKSRGYYRVRPSR